MHTKELMNALYQLIGNKVYLHDLEKLLQEKLTELSAKDIATIRFLTQDIREQQQKTKRTGWNMR